MTLLQRVLMYVGGGTLFVVIVLGLAILLTFCGDEEGENE